MFHDVAVLGENVLQRDPLLWFLARQELRSHAEVLELRFLGIHRKNHPAHGHNEQ